VSKREGAGRTDSYLARLEPTQRALWHEEVAIGNLSVVRTTTGADQSPLRRGRGNSLHLALRQGGLCSAAPHVVIGPGAVGLFALHMAKTAGVGSVAITGTERDRWRLGVAAALGADHTVLAHHDPSDLLRSIGDELGGPPGDRRGGGPSRDQAVPGRTRWPPGGSSAKHKIALGVNGERFFEHHFSVFEQISDQ
jgi:hypothetical protein